MQLLLPSEFLSNPPPPPPLPSSSQSASSSKTSQSGSLVDEVLTKSFSVNCDVDMSDKRQFIASCEDVGDLKKGENMRKYFIIACIVEMCTKSFLKSFKRKVHYHLCNKLCNIRNKKRLKLYNFPRV